MGYACTLVSHGQTVAFQFSNASEIDSGIVVWLCETTVAYSVRFDQKIRSPVTVYTVLALCVYILGASRPKLFGG